MSKCHMQDLPSRNISSCGMKKPPAQLAASKMNFGNQNLKQSHKYEQKYGNKKAPHRNLLVQEAESVPGHHLHSHSII